MIFNRYAKGGKGGLMPRIIVTAPTGSTVTCVKGAVTLTASEVSGTWTFNVPDYGTWTVNAVKGTDSASSEVVVDEIAVYNVEIVYLSTTLNDNSWAAIKSASDSRGLAVAFKV